MSGLSNIIENFIIELFEGAEDNIIEIQRNEMAQYFECSPSQINYVLSTRFTPYKGYYIESKRGGGGYIKIIKVEIEDYGSDDIIINSVGEFISKNKAYHIVERLYGEGFITEREEEIIKVALSDGSLSKIGDNKNYIRADILKNILLILLKREG